MKRTALLGFTLLVCVTGCQSAEKQTASVQDEEVIVTLKSSHSLKKRRLERRLALKNEVVAAVKYALSLEKRLFDHASAFKSKEQVYKHYRQGFGAKMAKRLTEYSWAGGETGLRPGDPSMEPPKKVEVSKINASEAVAYYRTPKWQRELWGSQKFTIVELGKEKDRWVIVKAKGVLSAPSY